MVRTSFQPNVIEIGDWPRPYEPNGSTRQKIKLLSKKEKKSVYPVFTIIILMILNVLVNFPEEHAAAGSLEQTALSNGTWLL